MNGEETNRLFAQIGEMSANIKTLLEYVRESKAAGDKRDLRIGVLERKVFFIWTLGGAALGVFAVVAAALWDQIKTKFGG